MNFEQWLEQEGPLFAKLGMLPVEKRQMKAAWDAAIDACLKATSEPMDQFFMWESMKELKSNAALTGERTE